MSSKSKFMLVDDIFVCSCLSAASKHIDTGVKLC